MSKATALVFFRLVVGFLTGAATRQPTRADAASQQKTTKWKHKCERPFNFDELTRTIEAREEQGWEMITVSPVVMTSTTQQDANAYLRYVACFKRVSTDE